MKLYKLTNRYGRTRNNTQWGENITHSVPPCENPRMGSDQVIHAYENPDLALVLNPIHADIPSTKVRVWEAEGGSGGSGDGGGESGGVDGDGGGKDRF